MKKLLITTAIGGVIFLIPLVIVVVVFGKAFNIMKQVSVPLQHAIQIETVIGNIAGSGDPWTFTKLQHVTNVTRTLQSIVFKEIF